MAEVLKKKKESFTIKVGEKELQLAVERPKQSHLREAQKVYNTTFREAVDGGAIVRGRVPTLVKEQNLWNDDKQKEHDALDSSIKESRLKITKGGKVSELRELAFKIKKDVAKLRELNSQRNSIDANTAEAQAEASRFNRLVSLCTVYDETGKPYFSSYDDYLDRSDEPIAIEAATKLMYLYYNMDPKFEQTLPENKFLKQWNMMNEDGKLLNKEGKTVDEEGRLINDENRYVDKDGGYVDKDGNPIDKDGNYVSKDAEPFLDDEGNPVQPPSSPAETVKT